MHKILGSEFVFGESQAGAVSSSEKLALPGSRWGGGNGLQRTPWLWGMVNGQMVNTVLLGTVVNCLGLKLTKSAGRGGTRL